MKVQLIVSAYPEAGDNTRQPLCTSFATKHLWDKEAYLALLSTVKFWVLCLQLVRDAEMLNPSEVAVLPVVLMQLYKQRSGREQAAVVTHPFFEGLIKPWALEPSKLTVQVRIVPEGDCLGSCMFP